ncbi:Uncharacterised protein [Actinobacillus equuli]|nr:Uncharacterised protein [Actinobacillus equuli]
MFETKDARDFLTEKITTLVIKPVIQVLIIKKPIL